MIKLVFRAVLAALSAGLLYLGVCLGRPEFMLWGVYCALGSNLVYALPGRPVFLLFQISFFFILLAEPGLNALRGAAWWPEGAAFSPTPLIAMDVSLLAAQEGDMLFNRSLGRRGRTRGSQGGLCDFVRRVSLIFLGLAFCCSIARFYLRYPLLDQFSALIGAFFCVYLSTRPETGGVYLAIGFYLIPTIPGLFGASEYTFTLRLLLCVGYLFIRRYAIWQGLALLLGLPAVLWAVALVRAGTGFSLSWLSQSFDAYVAQMGRSFEALVRAMPSGMTGGSRILQAVSDALSPEALLGALSGENISVSSGLGPFLADAFADWGYVGVALYSAAAGCCLAAVEWVNDRHYLAFTFLLMALHGLLALPGSTALAPVEFLLNPMFYLALMLCLLSALLCRAFSGGSRRRA